MTEPGQETTVPRQKVCDDQPCFCCDWERGWNEALDAVAALSLPARTET